MPRDPVARYQARLAQALADPDAQDRRMLAGMDRLVARCEADLGACRQAQDRARLREELGDLRILRDDLVRTLDKTRQLREMKARRADMVRGLLEYAAACLTATPAEREVLFQQAMARLNPRLDEIPTTPQGSRTPDASE